MKLRYGFITALSTLTLSLIPFGADAQAVIPLPPATVVTPGEDEPQLTPAVNTVGEEDDEVITLGDLLSDETDDMLTEDNATEEVAEEVDPLADFYERLEAEKLRLESPLEIDRSIDVSAMMLPDLFYLPVVFKPYDIKLHSPYGSVETKADAAPVSINHEFDWVNTLLRRHQDMEATIQQFAVQYPWTVKYNLENLPEAPKQYYATVDPKTATISVQEVNAEIVADAAKEIAPVPVKKVHWLHTVNGSLQFSQAYVSPNWYQGGNNNLNLIGKALWNVKLNPAYHSKLMFETTVQYNLAINSAPDDSLRNYSISQDLFQINSNFGLQATNHWYYSASFLFKTQLLNNYPTNGTVPKATFLAPGELNVGLGMTYSRSFPKGSVKVSLNPLSYNMKMCLNSRVNETSVGIKEGHKTVSQYGSNVEVTFNWKLAYNISYVTRLYAFTNYSYVQGDWENTLSFDINRFLSTKIFVHLRYDSSTKRNPDSKWHTWQLKEILSFGLSYTFSTI